MTGHRRESWPVPSGWRWSCQCGVKGRGLTRDDTVGDHLAHLKAEQSRTAVTASDAKRRALVRLPSRAVGELVYVPVADRRTGTSKGARARVRLSSGRFLSVDVGDLALVEPAGAR